VKRSVDEPGGSTLKLPTLALSSLRTKLLLFAFLLVTIPGAVFGLLAISSGRRALSEAVGRQLAEESRGVANSLSQTLGREFTELGTVARQDLMREIRVGDLDKRISAFLSTMKDGRDSILELRITDLEHRVVAATDPQRVGETDSSPPREASSGPSLRGPFGFGTRQHAALELGVPIPDPDRSEQIVGRLTALYDFERETAEMGQTRQNLGDLGLNVDILITDPSGAVIGGAIGTGSPTPVGTNLRTAGWSVTGSPPPWPQSAGFVVERGAGALVGYCALGANDPPWRILVAQRLSSAFEPVRSMTIRLALALLAVLVGALALAAWVADRVARPLRELTRAAGEIARGEPVVPAIASRSRDEVGQLTEAFNRMSVDLRRAQSEVLEVAKFAFVGELAAGVAHEVRTALGVLRSSSQLLQPMRAESGGEARELIQIMLEEIDHLDGVVNQLLDLGRPRGLVVEPSRLSSVVLRAADFVEAQARAKGVTIRRPQGGPDPIALCDEGQIYQVALNLIVNAVQVLPVRGEVALTLLAERDRTVGFEVRDDGPGIPDHLLQKILLPFFTGRDGGVGLGLTFVQRVIQEHKGRFTIESEVGKGSVFRVELPAAERQQ
jgi:two-component system, NtrC family, sensor histidine kinase HydH